MRELKAISQNLMHSSISITDGIYGNLTNEDVKETIANLDRASVPALEISTILEAILKLQKNPDLLNKILKS